MNITIIGGSKGTGAQLATIAIDADHDVTVVSRSGTAPAGARIVAGDATDADVLREAITGAGAVVVTVGGAKGVENQRATVTKAVIAAMEDVGVRRLIVQSSLGAGDSGAQMPAPLRVLMNAVLAKPLADHNAQEAAVFASDLDWTVIRPTGLKDKPATGTWRALEVSDEGTLSGSIPRGDVAACMLVSLGDDATIGKALGVSG